MAGDSLRSVDWKASATVGRLQVKLYEPSIALEIAIFLDLSFSGYKPQSRIDATELAIVIAASLASWIVATLDNTAIFGGLSVVGAGLHSIGLSRDKILACESALRDGGYLVLACGAADAICTAKEILESPRGLELVGGRS